MIAVPAVLGAIAVIHFPAVGRPCQTLEDVLCQVDGVVQVVRIHVADIDVKLTFELPSEAAGPVPMQDVRKVVVLPPGGCDVRIDLACRLVPDPARVTVVTDR
jgi:hypothetical protein